VVNKAVFLDRDGVINRALVRNGKPYAPRTLADFEILPGVVDTVQALKRAGYLMIVVTNQPDIGNGLVEAAVVEQMHAQLRAAMPIDEIYVCPHRQDEGCDCRKPKPGMLFSAKKLWNIAMEESYMVGDRYGDVQAGLAAGCTPIFIDKNYIETPAFDVNLRANDLPAAGAIIVQK
jgi:D-glycero-D-manno-heptose 1,7-bisphosphate phosphatase